MISLATLLSVVLAISGGSEPSHTPVAVPPPYVPDTELAKYPIVVIGKWEGAKFENKSEVEDSVLKKFFVTTRFVVEKVIKGEVDPGEQTVSMGYAIGWEEDGQVMSYMSTEMIGDADVSESNLWFLKRKSFDDGSGEKNYLHLESYRGIQPAELEPYFLALGKDDPGSEMKGLLASKSTMTVQRALYYVSGDNYPLPGWFDEDLRLLPRIEDAENGRTREPLTELSSTVEAIIENDAVGSLAAWTYADLLNEKSVPRMRQLLNDKDNNKACVAATSLIKHEDWNSIKQISEIAPRLKGIAGAGLIKQLESVGDEQAMPVLVSMLQTGKGDLTWAPSPAIDAQSQIEKRTGIQLPFDVELGKELWDSITALASKKVRLERINLLKKQFGSRVKAELVGDESNSKIRITNHSELTIEMVKLPRSIDIRTPRGLSSEYTQSDPTAVCQLKSGESNDFKIELRPEFFIWPVEKRSIEVEFEIPNGDLSRKSWAGTLSVDLQGENWNEEKPEVKEVLERWPNGNLKVKGQETNGIKTGKWDYFNESGDRVKTIEGGTTSVCNPDHPSNKGQGLGK